MQHVMLCGMCYEGTAQLLSLSFISLADPLTVEEGEKTGVPGEKPWRRVSENATY